MTAPSPPPFFGSADSKEVTGEIMEVRILKDLRKPVWEVCVDSKRVGGAKNANLLEVRILKGLQRKAVGMLEGLKVARLKEGRESPHVAMRDAENEGRQGR
jgi:hypothetical protein